MNFILLFSNLFMYFIGLLCDETNTKHDVALNLNKDAKGLSNYGIKKSEKLAFLISPL